MRLVREPWGDRDWLQGVGDDEGERDPKREWRVQISWTVLSHAANGPSWVKSSSRMGWVGELGLMGLDPGSLGQVQLGLELIGPGLVGLDLKETGLGREGGARWRLAGLSLIGPRFRR